MLACLIGLIERQINIAGACELQYWTAFAQTPSQPGSGASGALSNHKELVDSQLHALRHRSPSNIPPIRADAVGNI